MIIAVADQHGHPPADLPVDQPPAPDAFGLFKGGDDLVADMLDPGLEVVCGLTVEAHHHCEHRVAQQHGLAVTEFDVLITLHNAPGRRLRMSSLAEQVLLSPAGITHLVTRLERDRLVRREIDPSDRRKWYTVLTDHGDDVLKAARRTHNDVLRRGLLNITTPNERQTLQRLWTRLNQSRAQQPAPQTET